MIHLPTAIDTAFDRLIGGTFFGVRTERPLDRFPGVGRGFEVKEKPNVGDLQNIVDLFDIALDFGGKIVDRFDLAHFQCGC